MIPGLDLINKDSDQERKSELAQNGLKRTTDTREPSSKHSSVPPSQRTQQPPSPPSQQSAAGVNNIVERFLKNTQAQQAEQRPPPRQGPKTPPDPEEEEYDPAAPIDDSEEYDPAIPITDSEDYDPGDSFGRRRGDAMETEEEEGDGGLFTEAPREDLMERIAKMRGLFGQTDDGPLGGYEGSSKKHRHR